MSQITAQGHPIIWWWSRRFSWHTPEPCRRLHRYCGHVSQSMTTLARSLALLSSRQRTVSENKKSNGLVHGKQRWLFYIKVVSKITGFLNPILEWGGKRESKPGCTGSQSGFVVYNENRMNTHFTRLLPEYCRIHAERTGD